MTDLDVRIERLDPMRVAAVRAVGAAPESVAWQKMRAWAEPMGLLDDMEKHPVFGFNNPNPSPGQKEYGYEFIGLWDTYEKDGVEIARMELNDGGLCIGGELKFRFKISSEANIRGIRAELVQREIAKASGHTDDTKQVFVKDYFEENRIPRDQWLVG